MKKLEIDMKILGQGVLIKSKKVKKFKMAGANHKKLSPSTRNVYLITKIIIIMIIIKKKN